MSINYTASPLNSNETLLEQLLKIRKYLEKNPIYKIYLYLGEYDTNLGIYDSNLVHIGEGDELSKNDVVLFTNDYYAVVDSVDKETSTFTIINAYYFGANGTGTKIYINGVYSDRQDLTDDIQNQIDYLEGVDNELKESIGRNVDGIARLGTDKQDKLSQTDLDNIAMLNQLPDKLNAKANQSEVTQLATAVETNTKRLNNINIQYVQKDSIIDLSKFRIAYVGITNYNITKQIIVNDQTIDIPASNNVFSITKYGSTLYIGNKSILNSNGIIHSVNLYSVIFIIGVKYE